jgi:hypothetical protein
VHLVVDLDCSLLGFVVGDPYQLDFVDEIDVSLVGSRQWLQLGGPGALGAKSLSLIEEIVFGSDRPEAKAATLENAHHYHNLLYEHQGQYYANISFSIRRTSGQ